MNKVQYVFQGKNLPLQLQSVLEPTLSLFPLNPSVSPQFYMKSTELQGQRHLKVAPWCSKRY